uniref:Pirin N-terminal domain-containing protein n=1 Tax=Chromera velia CCMP2878 TaxID=1169474 RepID=A0A0G4GEK9_9ALVE|eukprot:Cvel_21464.t1-p1 / transcript=Cvel_21464.t1 / gene=Cvel_21464 / organism=Chromera_velia_CCMP2878 / gene_product=Pirin-like protein At1g50590, putative / transcript_product=Pirin-like protein At1g50590, putative / location=Cvel_scaffold2015:9964-15143(-) / protein_length=448 / sequence_SO=supercontig / SO=protein_coding / is_pseudo=false
MQRRLLLMSPGLFWLALVLAWRAGSNAPRDRERCSLFLALRPIGNESSRVRSRRPVLSSVARASLPRARGFRLAAESVSLSVADETLEKAQRGNAGEFAAVRNITAPFTIPWWSGLVRVFGGVGEGDPFMMWAHHDHNFRRFDPVRSFCRFFMEEGFPMHPHRGFQTMTYMLDGGFVHDDTTGRNRYTYRKGCVQWMSAGRGIEHEEMFETFPDKDAHVELFQIWVLQPPSHRHDTPRVQIAGEGFGPTLPVTDCRLVSSGTSKGGEWSGSTEGVESESERERGSRVRSTKGKVRVLLGEYAGVQSTIQTEQDVVMLHVRLPPGERFEMEIPPRWESHMYSWRGSVERLEKANKGEPAKAVKVQPFRLVTLQKEREGAAVLSVRNTERSSGRPTDISPFWLPFFGKEGEEREEGHSHALSAADDGFKELESLPGISDIFVIAAPAVNY